ncbi:PucR family transcriptional regulator [Donghicola sp. XS_ASV15]|uniref:PucR family transcriptional regulator n=1 Tax=Donghicola sp. XS_ASV15 TaxID=3241295 RepID=UPI003514FDF6
MVTQERRNTLMREAATRARADETGLRALDAAVVAAIGATEDPIIAARVRRSNRVNLEQWLSRTILDPARIPTYEATPDILRAAQENARSGQGETALAAFQAGHAVAWQVWSAAVFALTRDPEELRAVLEFSHRSISTFVAEAASLIRAENARVLADMTAGSPERRRLLVTQILEGLEVDVQAAGRRLGYRLDQEHLALIVWGIDPSMEPSVLDRLVSNLANLRDGPLLSINDDSLRRWVWCPVREGVELPALDGLCPPDLRIAVGTFGRGLDGFRQSHAAAQAAQRVLASAPDQVRVARHEDTRLPALLMADVPRARRFVSEVLGRCETVSPVLLKTLRCYLRQGESMTATAEVLGLHRNTVTRQLAQIEDRLPKPLATNRAELSAAVELLHWMPRRD